MKTKKILIALDFNPSAQKVSEVGYALAQALNAEVILLHVVKPIIDYVSPDMGYLSIRALSHKSIEGITKSAQEFLIKTKRHLDDQEIQTIVKEGENAETILKTAKELHITTIVMGSHSSNWLEDLVAGSVTKEVLRHSTVPLFIVPTKQPK